MVGDWARVGDVVRTARTLRWRRRSEFAAATGLSIRLISDLERGRRANYSPESKILIEDALAWQRGSIDRIAAGGRPKPVTDDALERLLSSWPKLSQDARDMLADLAERNRPS